MTRDYATFAILMSSTPQPEPDTRATLLPTGAARKSPTR